ncbi:putative transcriptional regulatory protein-like protein [Paramyrothecium foliicola]|nr:putative transcriptional regulatory protein-like protein [Paramyrothecium foliicola]
MDGSEATQGPAAAATATATALRTTACAECQRRKQKCDRLWPCNHCRKRKVADRCLYNEARLQQQQQQQPQQPPAAVDRKRARSSDRTFASSDEDDAYDDGASDGTAEGLDLQTLGYMGGPLLSHFGIDPQKHTRPSQEFDWKTPEECPSLKDVLNILPPRTQLDTLLQFFFGTINNHYYIIYGPKFLEEYHRWWDRRLRNKPLNIQWTALLTVMCAAVIQHLHAESEAWKSLGYSGTPDQLTERMHQLGRTLAHSISARRYHLLNVQRVLHSIYWYKAEARFVEAWHDIGAAVREAQELGLHRQAASDGLPDFEREMRRRVWCILVTWDWQFASGLCRPTLIDHTDVDVAQPTLHLENFYPSPLLHMKLQSEVIELLAARFGAPKNVQTPADILRYKEMLEQWIQSWPAVYDTVNPDLSKDLDKPWVTHHRYYIHTMAYLMILNPIRTYMANTYTKNSPADELMVRETGVFYSIKNLHTTTMWADYAHPRDGRFHFIIFSLFDTASVLAAAILKDDENTMPRKDEVLAGIRNAVMVLRKLTTRSKTAQISHDILSKIVRRLPRPPQSRDRKRFRAGETPSVAEMPCPGLTASPSTIDGRSLSDRSASGYTSEASPSSVLTTSASVTSSSMNVSQHGMTPESIASSIEPPMQATTTPPFSAAPYAPHDTHAYVNPEIQGMQQTHMGFDNNVQPDYFLDPSTSQVPQVYAPEAYAPPIFGAETGLDPITSTDLGDFSQLWDWRTLDFGFIVPDNAS